MDNLLKLNTAIRIQDLIHHLILQKEAPVGEDGHMPVARQRSNISTVVVHTAISASFCFSIGDP